MPSLTRLRKALHSLTATLTATGAYAGGRGDPPAKDRGLGDQVGAKAAKASKGLEEEGQHQVQGSLGLRASVRPEAASGAGTSSRDAQVSAEKVVKDIRRKTRRRFSAEEKIRIVLEGLRGEESIATPCRRGAPPVTTVTGAGSRAAVTSYVKAFEGRRGHTRGGRDLSRGVRPR